MVGTPVALSSASSDCLGPMDLERAREPGSSSCWSCLLVPQLPRGEGGIWPSQLYHVCRPWGALRLLLLLLHLHLSPSFRPWGVLAPPALPLGSPSLCSTSRRRVLSWSLFMLANARSMFCMNQPMACLDIRCLLPGGDSAGCPPTSSSRGRIRGPVLPMDLSRCCDSTSPSRGRFLGPFRPMLFALRAS